VLHRNWPEAFAGTRRDKALRIRCSQSRTSWANLAFINQETAKGAKVKPTPTGEGTQAPINHLATKLAMAKVVRNLQELRFFSEVRMIATAYVPTRMGPAMKIGSTLLACSLQK